MPAAAAKKSYATANELRNVATAIELLNEGVSTFWEDDMAVNLGDIFVKDVDGQVIGKLTDNGEGQYGFVGA